MPDLHYRQQKIQEKRKQTPWREFVKEMAGWDNLVFHKNNWLISKYPCDERTPHVISHTNYGSMWDQMNERTLKTWQDFFTSFQELWKSLQFRPCIQQAANENSDYVEMAFGAKNCYLSFTVGLETKNVFYTSICYSNCTNIYNSLEVIGNCENVYMGRSIFNSMNIFYSTAIKDCSDIRFSNKLIWCSHCIGCTDLQNQSYCMYDKQYTPEEYMERRAELLSSMWTMIQEYVDRKKLFFDYANHSLENCQSIIGSNNVENWYGVSYLRKGRNIIFVHWVDYVEEMYDVFNGWSTVSTHFYGWSNVWNSCNHLYCCVGIDCSSHLFYCYDLEACSYCLGCIWLKNKSFCILNKQYTKEVRHKKVDEIFNAMEKEWTLGDFFPGYMNPFYFNDTAAYLIDDSFTKEEVEAEGYLWREEEVKVDIPEGLEVVKVSELDQYEWWKDQTWSSTRHPELDSGSLKMSWDPSTGSGWQNASWEIDPTILDKVIQDERGNVYRIVKMEYDFLMKNELPLPRLHWLDRLKMHFKTS